MRKFATLLRPSSGFMSLASLPQLANADTGGRQRIGAGDTKAAVEKYNEPNRSTCSHKTSVKQRRLRAAASTDALSGRTDPDGPFRTRNRENQGAIRASGGSASRLSHRGPC